MITAGAVRDLRVSVSRGCGVLLAMCPLHHKGYRCLLRARHRGEHQGFDGTSYVRWGAPVPGLSAAAWRTVETLGWLAIARPAEFQAIGAPDALLARQVVRAAIDEIQSGRLRHTRADEWIAARMVAA